MTIVSSLELFLENLPITFDIDIRHKTYLLTLRRLLREDIFKIDANTNSANNDVFQRKIKAAA